MILNSKAHIEKILSNQTPSGFVFAPITGNGFAHHRNNGILPEELTDCESQLDMINYWGRMYSAGIFIAGRMNTGSWYLR